MTNRGIPGERSEGRESTYTLSTMDPVPGLTAAGDDTGTSWTVMAGEWR